MASTIRLRIASVQPSAKPASNPAGTPMPAAISTATTPASRLARAPNTTRESTSRPFSSVPIQCATDGALRIADHEVATGSYGAISGARSATDTNSTITTRPATATGRCRNRRTASCIGLRGIAAAREMAGVATVVLMVVPPPPNPLPQGEGELVPALPLPLREGVGGRGPIRILTPPSALD